MYSQCVRLFHFVLNIKKQMLFCAGHTLFLSAISFIFMLLTACTTAVITPEPPQKKISTHKGMEPTVVQAKTANHTTIEESLDIQEHQTASNVQAGGVAQLIALENEIFGPFDNVAALDVSRFREAYQKFEDELNEEQIVMQTWDRFIESPMLDIPVTVYEPNIQDDTSAALVFVHGGYFVAGSHYGVDHAARLIAKQTQMKVITVGYRLAPEFKFPSPVLDIVAVSTWLSAHGQTWGIDPARLMILGEGLGADIALGATLELSEQNVQPFKAIALLYGHYQVPEKTKYHHEGMALLNQTLLEWSYSQYLSSREESAHRYVNLLAADLTHLPDAYIVAADVKGSKYQAYQLANKLLMHQQDYVIETWTGIPPGGLMAAQLIPSVNYKLQKIASWAITALRMP